MGENAVAAETGRRLWAYLTDEVLRVFFFLPTFFAKDFLPTLLLCWILHYAFRVYILYVFETSPGKKWMGLRVRSLWSHQVSLGAASVRILADDLSIFLGFLPRIWAVIRFDRRQLSDFLAGTQVVQDKIRAQFPKRRWGLFWLVVVVSIPSVGHEALELLAKIQT